MSGLDTPKDAASFLSVNGKTSKKSMAHRGETTQSTMLLFEVLQLTDKNDAASLGVSRPLHAVISFLITLINKYFRLCGFSSCNVITVIYTRGIGEILSS